jgi:HTH-type transcriptional regulator / antitoxin HipB
MKAKDNTTTLDQILDKKYGKRGKPKREQWEQQFEAFRLGVLLEEARTKQNDLLREIIKKLKNK